jgi:AcrR family transcriptional regulator
VLRAAADFPGRRPNTTQDEIAAAVGVSRATLHRYFAGRAALLEALDHIWVYVHPNIEKRALHFETRAVDDHSLDGTAGGRAEWACRALGDEMNRHGDQDR